MRKLHICQGDACHWALPQRQCLWAYCCALRPSAWKCIHLSRRQCKSPAWTCCPRSPTVSQDHDSPMANEVLRPVSNLTHLWDILSGDVSGDGLTSHRTSRSSLMQSRRNGAGSPKQPLGGSPWAWGVVVSRAWRRKEALLASQTSVKLIYWPLPNSKSSSRHVTN